MKKQWVLVGRAEDFPEGLHLARAANRSMVVARLDGELHVFHPLCPHMGGPMELSEVQGAVIACPFHGWRFDLKNGGKEIHNYDPLRIYNVKVEAGQLFVQI